MKRLVPLIVLLAGCHQASPQQNITEIQNPKLTLKEEAELKREEQQSMQRFYGELRKAGFSEDEINRIKDPKHSYRLNCALMPTLQKQQPTAEEWHDKYEQCMEPFRSSEEEEAMEERMRRQHPEIFGPQPHKQRAHGA